MTIAERSRLWRQGKRALGLCTRCGKNPPKPGRTQCAACLRYVGERVTVIADRRMKAAANEGRCRRCMGELPEGWRMLACPGCIEKERNWRRGRKEAANCG